MSDPYVQREDRFAARPSVKTDKIPPVRHFKYQKKIKARVEPCEIKFIRTPNNERLFGVFIFVL